MDAQNEERGPADAGSVEVKVIPRHVAVIMDGNGRWAKARYLPRVEGHRAGARSVRLVVEESRRAGVRYLTLFSFSSENWLRPAAEVARLMNLFAHYLESEAVELKKNGVRLRAIGDLERLPADVQQALASAISTTEAGSSLDLVLAVSYGGRDELVQAARRLARQVKEGRLGWEDISAENLRANFYAPDLPDVDLLIRTSGECRVSNFLLWQLAYAEIVISPVLWPDFSRAEFWRCLKEYETRSRRFGLTEEQLHGTG